MELAQRAQALYHRNGRKDRITLEERFMSTIPPAIHNGSDQLGEKCLHHVFNAVKREINYV